MSLTIDQELQNGVDAHNEGNLQEAERIYRSILQSQPKNPDANHNLGILIVASNKPESALPLFKTALDSNPKIEKFWVGYINALINANQLQGAKLAIQKAKKAGFKGEKFDALRAQLAPNPKEKLTPFHAPPQAEIDNMIAHYQSGQFQVAGDIALSLTEKFPDHSLSWKVLAAVFKQVGEVDGALAANRNAVRLDPNDAEAHGNLGAILHDLGQFEDAINCYEQALKINPVYLQAYYNIGITLKSIDKFSQPMPDLSKIICKLLEKAKLVRPVNISKATISLLKFDPVIKDTIKKYSEGKISQSLQETMIALSNIPLLLKLMVVCPITDPELEAVFKSMRSAILLSISDIKNNSKIIRFQCALSLQCFTNEYLYDQADEEIEALKKLENLLQKKLANGQQPSSSELTCLASYKALHEYPWIQSLTIPIELEVLQRSQILEPNEEKRLKLKMPLLQELKDNISCKVREQYEKNPYPRWVNIGLPIVAEPISSVTKDLKLLNFGINEVSTPQILIAGCGTGQHSITTASRFSGCNVLAIDLSLSSLAYAKRKTEELGISNIEYMQADILDLAVLDRKFDIIESAGVLHHMNDPMAGWKVLTDCLKSEGLMFIGLYSELARRDIVQMRDEIKRANIDSSDKAMKLFRKQILCSEDTNHKRIMSLGDFYSMSTLRDLLFHLQEHRFTIPKIKDSLNYLGLEFCGFGDEEVVKKFKSKGFSENSVYDLERWDDFEKQNSDIFLGMYNFWCQKI